MVPALDQASRETHFEVHVLKNGRWMIEATSAEQKIAVDDAKDLLRQSDIRAVKVFKETTNHDLGRSAAISVFSHEKPERRRGIRPMARVDRKTTKPAPAPKAQAKPASMATAKRPAADGNSSPIPAYMMVGSIVVMLAAAGIYFYTSNAEPDAQLPTTIDIREKPAWLTKPLK